MFCIGKYCTSVTLNPFYLSFENFGMKKVFEYLDFLSFEIKYFNIHTLHFYFNYIVNYIFKKIVWNLVLSIHIPYKILRTWETRKFATCIFPFITTCLNRIFFLIQRKCQLNRFYSQPAILFKILKSHIHKIITVLFAEECAP